MLDPEQFDYALVQMGFEKAKIAMKSIFVSSPQIFDSEDLRSTSDADRIGRLVQQLSKYTAKTDSFQVQSI